jgi:hypothetical protein
MRDMIMLALTGGCPEQAEAEYTELLARAGFNPTRMIATRSTVSMIEALPSPTAASSESCPPLFDKTGRLRHAARHAADCSLGRAAAVRVRPT